MGAPEVGDFAGAGELYPDFGGLVGPVEDAEQGAVLQFHGANGERLAFELGGDSIRSITILSRAQQVGLHFTLQQIFQSPTVAQLAACAGSAPTGPRPQQSEAFSLVSAEDKGKLPQEVEFLEKMTVHSFSPGIMCRP